MSSVRPSARSSSSESPASHFFCYLLIHIAGNLLVFFGPDVFNRYAYVIEERIRCCPVIELGLLLVFLIHVYKTVRMFFGNQAARPVGYAEEAIRGLHEPEDASPRPR